MGGKDTRLSSRTLTVVLQTSYCGGLLENFILLVSLLTVHDEEFVAAI